MKWCEIMQGLLHTVMKTTSFCVEEVKTTDISEEYAASIKKGKTSKTCPLLAFSIW